MKLILLSLSALTLAILPSCTDSEASAVKSIERPPENGAQYEKGKGLSVTEEMARSIGLKTADVEEQKIAARVQITLRPLPGGKEANGWLTAAQVGKIQPGANVLFSGAVNSKGTIQNIEKPAFAETGDFEVTVSSNPPLPEGAEIQGAILLNEKEAAASIPRSALLSTAEGYFVYAVNGNYFFRTAVTVGAMNEDHAEITEGLFAGDAVVTTPVMSLWMAELQVLRGGKACTCGH
jgi:hypothetical protein